MGAVVLSLTFALSLRGEKGGFHRNGKYFGSGTRPEPRAHRVERWAGVCLFLVPAASRATTMETEAKPGIERNRFLVKNPEVSWPASRKQLYQWGLHSKLPQILCFSVAFPSKSYLTWSRYPDTRVRTRTMRASDTRPLVLSTIITHSG